MSEGAKLYFRDIDSEFCYPLGDHIAEAIDDELEEVTLVEAVPDFDNKDYIWCTIDGVCVERSECKKAYCTGYQSKSGRGIMGAKRKKQMDVMIMLMKKDYK